MVYSERIQPSSDTRLLIQQWRTLETWPRRLTEALLSFIDAEIVAPSVELELQYSVATASGYFLDLIGERLLFPRPRVAADENIFFGFERAPLESTDDVRSFDQAPFHTINRFLEYSQPLSDAHYRRMLQARGISVRGNGTVADIEAAAARLWSGGGVVSTVANTSFTLTVTESDEDFFTMTTSDAYAGLLLGLPAGVAVTFVKA